MQGQTAVRSRSSASMTSLSRTISSLVVCGVWSAHPSVVNVGQVLGGEGNVAAAQGFAA